MKQIKLLNNFSNQWLIAGDPNDPITWLDIQNEILADEEATWSLKIIEISEEEYNNLPEFDGF